MSSKRGRKRNDTLPPNRARDVQRAFRARRAAHLVALEQRIVELEEENNCLRRALQLPPAHRPVLGRGPTGKDRPISSSMSPKSAVSYSSSTKNNHASMLDSPPSGEGSDDDSPDRAAASAPVSPARAITPMVLDDSTWDNLGPCKGVPVSNSANASNSPASFLAIPPPRLVESATQLQYDVYNRPSVASNQGASTSSFASPRTTAMNSFPQLNLHNTQAPLRTHFDYMPSAAYPNREVTLPTLLSLPTYAPNQILQEHQHAGSPEIRSSGHAPHPLMIHIPERSPPSIAAKPHRHSTQQYSTQSPSSMQQFSGQPLYQPTHEDRRRPSMQSEGGDISFPFNGVQNSSQASSLDFGINPNFSLQVSNGNPHVQDYTPRLDGRQTMQASSGGQMAAYLATASGGRSVHHGGGI